MELFRFISSVFFVYILATQAIAGTGEVSENKMSMMSVPDGYTDKYNNLKGLKRAVGEAQKLGGAKKVKSLVLPLLSESEKAEAKDKLFAIRIRHKHLLVSNGQVLAENASKNGDYLEAFPQPFNPDTHLSCCWGIDDKGNISADEWSEDSGLQEVVNDTSLSLIRKVLLILKENNLHTYFGVSSVKRTSLPLPDGYVYDETTTNEIGDDGKVTSKKRIISIDNLDFSKKMVVSVLLISDKSTDFSGCCESCNEVDGHDD